MSARDSTVLPGQLSLFDEEELAALERQASRPCPVCGSTKPLRWYRLRDLDKRVCQQCGAPR
jgi:predicted RNA-binding Zn-ribbon protein involved in translation (DUF1610 family)